MTADVIHRAQKALLLCQPQKNPKEDTKLKSGIISGHKVAILGVLAGSSALIALAATISFVFASYIVAAICAAALVTVLLSTVLASRLNISKKILTLLDNLAQNVTDLFNKNLGLHKDIDLLKESLKKREVLKKQVEETKNPAALIKTPEEELKHKVEELSQKLLDSQQEVEKLKKIKDPLANKEQAQQHIPLENRMMDLKLSNQNMTKAKEAKTLPLRNKKDDDNVELKRKLNEVQDRETLLKQQLKQKEQELQNRQAKNPNIHPLQKQYNILKQQYTELELHYKELVKEYKDLDDTYNRETNEWQVWGDSAEKEIDELKKKLLAKVSDQTQGIVGILSSQAHIANALKKVSEDLKGKFKNKKHKDKIEKVITDLLTNLKQNPLETINGLMPKKEQSPQKT